MIATQASQVVQRISYDVLMHDGSSHSFAIEQIPEGFRLNPVFTINMWRLYGHMSHKTYLTIEALLDDACPGWSSYNLYIPQKPRSAREETALIKKSLESNGIQARVMHYRGALVIELGRPIQSGDWDHVRSIAEGALGEAGRFAYGGLHVFEKFEGKKKAGWGRGNRRMFF